MATTFFLRDQRIGIQGASLLRDERGGATQNLSVDTVAGGTWIVIQSWSTRPLTPFTLSGPINIRIRAAESNNVANTSIECRIYKWSRVTGLSAALLTLKQSVELTTTDSSVNLSGTPATTVFNSGEALIVDVGITNAPGTTMGGNRSVTISYNGPTDGASGDSYIQIDENVVQRDRITVTE
jgi:hypothetical protein